MKNRGLTVSHILLSTGYYCKNSIWRLQFCVRYTLLFTESWTKYQGVFCYSLDSYYCICILYLHKSGNQLFLPSSRFFLYGGPVLHVPHPLFLRHSSQFASFSFLLRTHLVCFSTLCIRRTIYRRTFYNIMSKTQPVEVWDSWKGRLKLLLSSRVPPLNFCYPVT